MPLFEDVVHKALASGIRRDVLLSLAGKSKYLTEIAGEIKRKPQTVDFHLKLLEGIGLVEGDWEKGKKYYTLKNKEILNFLRERRPVPAKFRPRPPHEIVLEAWKDLSGKLDRIEKKIDKLASTRR
jgi:DNA-binding transcriptional ArsR family regulator